MTYPEALIFVDKLLGPSFRWDDGVKLANVPSPPAVLVQNGLFGAPRIKQPRASAGH